MAPEGDGCWLSWAHIPKFLGWQGVQSRTAFRGMARHHLQTEPPHPLFLPPLQACIAQAAGTDFVVGGDGSPLRQFIYSDDLARLILLTYLHYTDIAVPRILCPPGAETTIGNVARSIAAHFGIHGRLRFDPSKPNGQARKTVVPTDDPGMAFTGIEEGLGKAIEWFLDNKRPAEAAP